MKQLNKYGFRKFSIKKDEHYFYHAIFRRDNLQNLSDIKRKKKGKNHISSQDESQVSFCLEYERRGTELTEIKDEQVAQEKEFKIPFSANLKEEEGEELPFPATPLTSQLQLPQKDLNLPLNPQNSMSQSANEKTFQNDDEGSLKDAALLKNVDAAHVSREGKELDHETEDKNVHEAEEDNEFLDEQTLQSLKIEEL